MSTPPPQACTSFFLVSLPYFKEPEQLPAPLPTAAEFQASNKVLGDRTAQRTVAVGKHYVVKYGHGVSLVEGQTLLYVEQKLAIPAPTLFALYKDEKLGYVLIMAFVKGERLDELWPSLVEEEKRSILLRLRDSTEQMRALSPPAPSFFGSVDRGQVPNELFFSFENDQKLRGPFSTEDQFSQALVEKLKLIYKDNNFHSHKPDMYARHFAKVLRCHKPTFTHSDIQKKNILVCKVGIDGSYNFEVTLIDWEFAGWYPEYWEYFAAFSAFKWEDDWVRLLDSAIDSWPAETATMDMILHDLLF